MRSRRKADDAEVCKNGCWNLHEMDTGHVKLVWSFISESRSSILFLSPRPSFLQKHSSHKLWTQVITLNLPIADTTLSSFSLFLLVKHKESKQYLKLVRSAERIRFCPHQGKVLADRTGFWFCDSEFRKQRTEPTRLAQIYSAPHDLYISTQNILGNNIWKVTCKNIISSNDLQGVPEKCTECVNMSRHLLGNFIKYCIKKWKSSSQSFLGKDKLIAPSLVSF